MATVDDEQQDSSPVGVVTQLVGALAAGGGALLAGVKLSTLGALNDPLRLGVALTAAAVVAGVVIAGILMFVDQMTPPATSLSSLSKEEEHARTPRRPPAVTALLLEHGYADVQQLEAAYTAAVEHRHTAFDKQLDRPTEKSAKAAQKADEEAHEVNAVVAAVMTTTKADQVEQRYQRTRRRFPLLAGGLLLSLAAFLWATNPPAPAALDLRGADLTGASLRGVELRDVVLDGMTITRADLQGTHLDDASIDHTTWVDTICPDGVNSDDAGRTCAGHLKP